MDSPGASNEIVLREFTADLKKFQSDVAEIHQKQEAQLQNLEQVKTCVQSSELETVDSLMQIIRVYKDKLCGLRTRMLQIHSKARNMKDQSLRIQQIAVERVADRVEKRFYEENLIRKSPQTKAPESEQ